MGISASVSNFSSKKMINVPVTMPMTSTMEIVTAMMATTLLEVIIVTAAQLFALLAAQEALSLATNSELGFTLSSLQAFLLLLVECLSPSSS